MAKLSEKKTLTFWRNHMNSLSKKDTAIVGRTIRVQMISGSDIGYTMPADKKKVATICLNPCPDGFEVPKTIEEQIMMVDGVNLHEVGHQLFTDFNALLKVVKYLNEGDRDKLIKLFKFHKIDFPEIATIPLPYGYYETSLFKQVSNIVEDPSIEYWVLRTVGGSLNKALRWMINYTWKVGPSLDECTTPFAEVFNSMIAYGDVGLLKGTMSDEAKKYFLSIQKIFDQAIECPNGMERTLLSLVILEKLRPLWQSVVDDAEARDKLMKELSEMSDSSHDRARGKGEFSDDASELAGEEDESIEKTKSRKKRVIEMTRKEYEEALKRSKGSGSGGEEVEIRIIDDPDSDDKSDEEKSGAKSGSKSDAKSDSKSDTRSELFEGLDSKDRSEKEASSDGSGSEEEKTEDGSKSGGSTVSDPEESKDEGESTADKAVASDPKGSDEESTDGSFDGSSDGSVTDKGTDKSSTDSIGVPDGFIDLTAEELDIDKEAEIINDELTLDQEMVDELLSIITEESSDDPVFEESKDSAPDDYKISGVGFTNASCKNVTVNTVDPDLASEYDEIVSKMARDITLLSGQLKRSTQKQNVVKAKKTSGKINIDRYSKFESHPTTRVFDKRRSPANTDLAVYINVDESGSMIGSRTRYARNAAIGIAEACAKANIPVYIMGFTGDIGDYQAYHIHYVRWKNTRRERISLMNIQARRENFDGYSIRYSTEILKKRPEGKKLLIVISDGAPACHTYYSQPSGVGVADTKAAVRQATNSGIVVHGIAIGGCDTGILKDIYGIHFTANGTMSGLLRDLGKAVITQLKNK